MSEYILVWIKQKKLNSKIFKNCNIFNEIAKYRTYAKECKECSNKKDYANSKKGKTTFLKK